MSRSTESYVPTEDAAWERIGAADAGFDPDGLASAVAFARSHGTAWPVDVRAVIESGAFDPPPWNRVLGPTKPRGEPCGLVLSGGRIVASWGDVGRPDMVFSVTKSYLGVLAGVAVDLGLIENSREPVRRTCPDPRLESAQNRDVSWLDLLWQSSEMAIELWGIPDTVDRNRQLSPHEDRARFNQPHSLQPCGTYWDYNDVRVNFLCLALTRLFGRALDEVLRKSVAAPIGMADGWRWWGLYNGHIDIDGRSTACVVGGGHWGGGLVTSARHDARLGLLVSHGGTWGGRRVVSERWLREMLHPCALNPVYGALWLLNTDHILHRSASARSVFAKGVGMNAIWVDAERDLVVVTRWIDADAFDGFVSRLMASRQD